MTRTFIPTVEQVPGGVIPGYYDTDNNDGRAENPYWLPAVSMALQPRAVPRRMRSSGVETMAGRAALAGRPDTAAVGHSGSDPGFGATMACLPGHDIAIVVLTNDSRADPTDLTAVTAPHACSCDDH